MDDFLSKIKKKLSVDNILDLMKDGKLKEEIKQSLTATVNLNEKPKPDDFRPSVEVPSLEHSTEEGQSKVNLIAKPENPDASAIRDQGILEPVTHVTVENIYHETAEGRYKLPEKRPEEQFKEETTSNTEMTKQSTVQLNEQKGNEDKMDRIKEDTKKQSDDKEPDSKKSDDGMETTKSNTNVLQKTSQQENADKFNFEIFLG